MWLERYPAVDLVFSILFTILVVERIVSTFLIPKPKPTRRIFHKNFFFLLLFVYLFIVIFSVAQYYSNVRLNIFISSLGLIMYISGSMLRNVAILSLSLCWGFSPLTPLPVTLLATTFIPSPPEAFPRSNEINARRGSIAR